MLFGLALDVMRLRGLPVRPTTAEFHLPLELLAAHLEISRETLWRNLKPLTAAGVLAERDHYGTLDGRTAVTGKIWAVSLDPARVLAGRANRVRISPEAMKYPWRDLDRDRREGRTVFNLTRTDEQKAQAKQQREQNAQARAEAQERANQRKAARVQATARGEKPLKGRAAATVNAARTRAEKSPPSAALGAVQQSIKSLKTVDRAEVVSWVLTPFLSQSESVTLTVASGPTSALEAIYTLPSLTGLSKKLRGTAVEESARTLAAAFDDTANLRFWCWLLWQMLRASDQGQHWADDISCVLARVLHDLKHDETMHAATAKRRAALVVAALNASGLLEALRQIAPTRVGVKPQAHAA
ncbi:hypothetical protein [Deinococcus ruber]|uniref:hypothetical protein n=1 Tax=Deinococcus ruber TaxID=1848197 RepID=UPI0016692D3D|nr:hypothetical protein [Deinococcus ruber]